MALTLLTGTLTGFAMVLYEDGVPFGRFKKIKCKLGFHKRDHKIGKFVISRKYYCEHCKAPRKHPQLKVLQGGKKEVNNTFKF